MPQACGYDSYFGRKEAILPGCIFAYSDGEWAEPLKQNIFRGAFFEDFMFSNDLQVCT